MSSCKSQLPLLSAQHKVISVGCEANNVMKNNFDVTKPLVMDKIVKDVFLCSWKKLQLAPGKNLDQMIGNIHMMYEDRENDEIIFFKTQKHFSSHLHNWYNHQALHMFLNCKIDEQKLWEEKSPPYRNKSEKKKGENTSEILTKRRRKDENCKSRRIRKIRNQKKVR